VKNQIDPKRFAVIENKQSPIAYRSITNIVKMKIWKYLKNEKKDANTDKQMYKDIGEFC